jgi:GNAT superfamily N-acetyltransferase
MQQHEIVIRDGKPEDVPEVIRMIKELAAFELEPDAVLITEEELLADGFSDNPIYHLKIATSNTQTAGMALFYFAYSTWKGKYLYLEDFYVNPEFRGQGIGKKLFDAVLVEAKQAKVRRMGWQVLKWNDKAIKFYEQYQAELSGEWLNGRLHFDV